ncbi:NAD(P)H-dependent oxidoreductase [Hydrogenimonas cancrithermarum]|uniref:NAD(P)H-dependent oxidoreductase n=1 Tax=Hydrogenimonas cancrithermarum TaxID=2993563 RepID=A0ABN6WW49_9BACT|nr:NAD(P)H-dependent oxidoreductase [Hydrogenimonas cancrithermarum]BDY13093.1 NAD(P)H-dependent oxidoreductase [Hydrogenimonas cancrithermarum]
MENREVFLKAMQERYSCKRFDENRKIPKEDLEMILEFGRLSPSSFGMEPWRFSVVQSQTLKERIRPLCWDQPQITTCSDLVLVKSILGPLAPGSRYSRDMLSRRDLPKEKVEAYCDLYDTFAAHKLATEGLFCWGSKQCYIAAANMMTGAAAMGIDSCPIEGFEKEKVEALLEMDPAKEELALIIAFGYRVKPAPEKIRLPLDQIVEYL